MNVKGKTDQVIGFSFLLQLLSLMKTVLATFV